MNIVVISNGSRPELLRQTLSSLRENAADWDSHTIALVMDGPRWYCLEEVPTGGVTVIVNPESQGSSASRNIGASSIPKYRRQNDVMFCDDDIYATSGWDRYLENLGIGVGPAIISGYSHPFNRCEPDFTEEGVSGAMSFGRPLVISSVAMMMPWQIFDEVGPWDEPGGAGASEDYALCMRAKNRGYGFAVTSPQCILHTGMSSSNGKLIVGHDELEAQNRELMTLHGLKDIIFQ